MKEFYVTFGMGSLLRGYHVVFQANSEEIVRVFMQKKVQIPWSSIYTTVPKGSKPLQPLPEVLCYEKAEHVR